MNTPLDDFTCPICGREKSDDEDICGRCYDDEHGPDETRYVTGDFPTDRELLEKLSQYGGRIWR